MLAANPVRTLLSHLLLSLLHHHLPVSGRALSAPWSSSSLLRHFPQTAHLGGLPNIWEVLECFSRGLLEPLHALSCKWSVFELPRFKPTSAPLKIASRHDTIRVNGQWDNELSISYSNYYVPIMHAGVSQLIWRIPSSRRHARNERWWGSVRAVVRPCDFWTIIKTVRGAKIKRVGGDDVTIPYHGNSEL